MVNTKIRLIIFFAAKDGEILHNQQKKADCGSDHELLKAKFTLKLKKVRKTTRPFRYDLNHAYNAGDLGSIPGSGRSPGEGNGNPPQYSCLENPMDGGAWWAIVHGVAKSRTRLRNFTLEN